MSAFALASSGTHVVRSGETLRTVAADHDTTIRQLVEANGIENPDLILVGQRLTIPGDGSTSSETVTHTVRRGDTLAKIAGKYGTTVAAIAEANGIADPNLIVIGRDLTVAGTSGGSGGGASGSSGSSRQLSGQRHEVRLGDTIAGIARRYGLSVDDLVRWNGLVDGRIYSTTRLLLYDPGTLPDLDVSAGTRTHTVQSGETLSTIAHHYGVRPSSIASATGLEDPDRLQVGQQLTVPGASGSVQCPVPGASFFNDWGFPRSGGRSHSGNDLFAPRGTAVRAPVAGDVDVAEGRIGGKQFRLTAPDGTEWFGSHLNDFGARGQVAAGEVIGYVGDSGNAQGGRPHLHFEIHVEGNAVNPYPLLRAVC